MQVDMSLLKAISFCLFTMSLTWAAQESHMSPGHDTNDLQEKLVKMTKEDFAKMEFELGKYH